MRVSAIAILAALCMVASAETALKGRALYDRKKEDSRSQVYTDTFNMSPNTWGPDATFDGGNQIGLILGFVITGCFMIFAWGTLIWDEKQRHEAYRKLLLQDENYLRTMLRCGPDDFAIFEKEFEEQERARFDTKEAAKQRAELAEIN